MEAASNAEPKRSYSWWWDSHITPKNSKWLQDNLTDMDNKIKAMIKLIEEDADSFARRAEMYYKKRPDLMKLVEEFYRAYRALAERYDHVTGALRQAHRTIAVAFPNQIQSTLPDEPPSGFPDNVDEDTTESEMQTTSNMQTPTAIQCDGKSLDEIVPFISNEGLKYLNWLFVDEDAHKKFSEFNWKKGEGKHFEYQKLEEENSDLSKENKILKNEVTLESQRADKAEAELQCLKDAISKLKTELESALLQYQISEERISSLESEISVSQAKCLDLNDEMDIKASKLSITEERCLGLERENTSLKLKLDKVNLVVSKQQEEVSDLLNENQNLHNRLDSESRRADRAETDIFSSKDAVLRLKSEMESALLQNQLSQGRISDLEAEIFRTKEQFKNVNLEMSIRASKLNMAENQCLLLQEENKFLQRELDKFMKKVTNQGAEIIMREEELDRLEQSIEVERQRNMQAEIMENSLHTKVNKLEQIVKRQEEEIAIREQELNKLKQHVEDGWKQRLQSERAYQVLVELHSQTQENSRHLGLENQYGAEMLRKTELRTSALEEEIKHLRDENNSLNEENFTSVSRIICLQDELISLKAFKHKIHDELRFNAEEKLFLQQELSSYKNNRYDLEEGHHELIEKLRRMELREATFEEELRCLHDENIGLYEKFFQFSSKIVNLQDDNICLRESNSKLEEELQFHLEEKKVLQQDLFSLKSQKNVLGECNQQLTELNNEVNCNVITLHAMVKELQDENKELRDTCKKYEDKQNMLMESMEDKSAFLDISLSGANAELRNLLDKIKGLKEYSESLYDNVHSHISLEPVLVSHFEAVTQNTVKLSEKHSVLENSISDLNVEFDVLRGMVKALEEPCQSLYYQNSHLITENSNLVSQVEKVGLHLQSLENRFVVLEGKQVNTEEKNLTLYHIQEEHDDDICFFRNQLRALITQIHLVKKQNQITKEVLDEEDHFKTVKSEIDSFMFKQFLVDLNEKNMFLSKECWKYMEKLELAENFIFELKEEWASQEVKLITMSDRNEKLLGGIHVMMKTCDTKKASESYDTKKNFENSNDGYDKILQNILHRIVELHGTIAAAKGDIHNFQLEKPLSFTLLEQLALILTELRAQKNVPEQGSLLRNQEILVLHKKNHELMEINDRSWKDINASKQREDLLTLEMESICVRLLDLQEAFHASEGVNSKLVKENELLSKKLYDLRDQSAALKEENDAILEKAITQEQLSLIFRKYNAEKSSDIEWLIRDVNCLYRITNDLSQEIKMISKSKGAREAEKKIQQALKALKKLDKEIETRKTLLEQSEVENNFFSLSEEENSCKDYEIGCLQTSNKLHKVVEMLGTKENDLTSELQVSIDECKFYKEATTKLLYDLHSSSFMELIFKEKFFELMEILKGLETVDIVQSKIRVEETGILNVQEADLKDKLDALGRENKELKEELNAFVSLVVSLEKEIAYLEDHTLSLTNFHILSSKRKKGNILDSFHRKKGSQIRATLPSPRASSGIFELKKLRAKVKGLQKEVTDTKGPLEQENTVSGTNETRKSKGLKSQKKKNIILDLRKGDNTSKDVKQLKEETFSKERQGQMIKDIELDHVLSNSQHQAVFNVETYSDHTLVVCEKERSKNPSSELVLEELNIDNLNYNKYLREWNDSVNVSLSAGSQRLLTLRNSMEELKMKIKTSETKCQLSASELDTVKMQVKEVEESLIKLTDFNFKLTEATKTFSESSDSSKLRRKVEESIQSGMEKMDRLEMKLQKVQFVFVKLQEELQECRTPKSLERRSKLPLKDLIYGKKSDPKQMKRRFCACMRFKVKDK